MSIGSILSNVGHGLKLFFAGAVKVAQVAEPFVDIAFPGIAVLFNTTVNAVAQAEMAAAAAGVQTGSGPQKLAFVVASIESSYEAYAKANGISYDAAKIEAWANAVVASLNAIPAPSNTGIVPA